MNDTGHGGEAGLFTLLHAAGTAQDHVEAKLAEVSLSVAKLANYLKHFVRRDIATSVLNFVGIDCFGELTARLRQISIRIPKLPSFNAAISAA